MPVLNLAMSDMFGLTGTGNFGMRKPAPESMQPCAFVVAEGGPCPHCDDTGDVHTIDGEWRGLCSCPAGDFARAMERPIDPPSVLTISAPLPPAGDVPTITIGDINERLCGVTIRADFLESKGFRGLKKGSWIVYAEADWPRIKAAIIEHLRGVK